MLWPLEQAAEVLAFYARLHRPRAGGAERLLRLPHRAARAAVPRGAAPAEDVRRRLVLRRQRRARPRRRSRRSASALPPALDGVDGDAAARAAVGVRRALSAGRPVVLARRLRRGRFPPRRSRRTSSMHAKLPTWKSTMHLYPIDGAAGRVASDATAWGYRDARWAQVIVGVDPDPAQAGALRDWAVGYWEALHPLLRRRRLRQLPDGGGPGARRGRPTAGTTSGSPPSSAVRPGEPLPRQPEHPARTGARSVTNP